MPARTVSRTVPYSPEQLFDLVVDVEHYPLFVPSWAAARVIKRLPDGGYRTDQILRVGPMREEFITETHVDRPNRIEVVDVKGPFDHLHILWNFTLVPEGACHIDLSVDVQLRSRALRALSSLLAGDSVERLVHAFEERARHVYGPPHPLAQAVARDADTAAARSDRLDG
ncbi:Putative oligoketide cyclase/dehydratase or lipid transport protein YfjG [Caenispirillum salinarum AK4]|uniref:Putative oligoketide cyclase/dehydratase or lipid transport protein YfjG n=1 Tax=Caenispirillum salinarum AK4 TaxID=1238182 RepID=K9HQY2_9PROT|nr:type II toxin-antitoxin system RatA family toxin [Caenispirillum salinarum]EKV30856.1 Putative oligoketide cyclase/dehydratase or lipid transport protein YfjG [Caenispirillum salinarum AK4]